MTFCYPTKFTHFYLQQTNDVVSKHLLVSIGDQERSISVGDTVRPILLALDLLVLLEVGYHDNGVDVFLPDHPPKVNQSLAQWT